MENANLNYADLIVVGGGPAGMIAAVSAKAYYPDKKILLIKSVEDGVIPCGIPYMFKTLDDPEKNALGNACLDKRGIVVEVGKVDKIDKDAKAIFVGKRSIGYDRLIIATGSKPLIFPIDGIDKKGIYPIFKQMSHLKYLRKDIDDANDIVIIGGGFIGAEFADEISDMGKKVTLIEFRNEILTSFDSEFAQIAHKKLEEKGVKILTSSKVVGFGGDERVSLVRLEDGREILAQVVVLGMGAKPNGELGKLAGLDMIGSAIAVDEYLRTSDKNILAAGDCCAKTDFFTKDKTNVMLASTATSEARIAGSSAWNIKVIRENKGTIAVYSTKIGDIVLASAGLTEAGAKDFDIVVGVGEAPNRHPGSIPGMTNTKVKLIFSRQSGLLLGGQVVGGQSAGETINIISLAIQKNTTLSEIETLQIATHPKLTAAPTMYPIVTAALDALSKMN